MATFLVGLAAGVYVGTVLREEYYFPTAEKINQALVIFQKNEAAIRNAKKEPEGSNVGSKAEVPSEKKG